MIGYAIFVQGKKVPLKKFFNVTSILLIFVCAGLVAYGVHEFEEAFYTKDEMKKLEIWNINDSGPVFGFNLDGYGKVRIYGFLAERFLPFWFNKYSKYLEWPIIFRDLRQESLN